MSIVNMAITWLLLVTGILAFMYGATGCSDVPLRPHEMLPVNPAAMVARTHERLSKHGPGACKHHDGTPIEGCR